MEKEENIDATEELVEPYGEYPAPEAPNIRGTQELRKIPYEDLTEDEKKYLITALFTKTDELEGIVQRAFKQIDALKKSREKELGFIADSLTFIKTEVGQCFGSVNLAIKNIESEVRRNGN